VIGAEVAISAIARKESVSSTRSRISAITRSTVVRCDASTPGRRSSSNPAGDYMSGFYAGDPASQAFVSSCALAAW
jgi:hypothetical protein